MVGRPRQKTSGRPDGRPTPPVCALQPFLYTLSVFPIAPDLVLFPQSGAWTVHSHRISTTMTGHGQEFCAEAFQVGTC